MIIMVFLHGTVLMHAHGAGRTREERVRQVLEGDESLDNFAAYLPVGDAARKLRVWSGQGAEIAYLSSHRRFEDVQKDVLVLLKHGFPGGPVYFRQEGEDYGTVAERALPDVLIEDDCESIGGVKEMTYPQIEPGIQVRVKSIVVKEFGGIDDLPDDILELVK